MSNVIDDLRNKNSPTKKPTPLPLKPIPTPLKPTPVTCIYNPHDNLALEIRKAIFTAPTSCKTEISSVFTDYLKNSATPGVKAPLPFAVITECKTYIAQTSFQNFNTSSPCTSALFDGATEYARTYPGNTVTYFYNNSCTAYLTSFIKDFHTHPTDLVHLAGCNATNIVSIEVPAH